MPDWIFPFDFALSGCIEVKDEFIINPDGTGKVIHQATLQRLDFGFNASDEKNNSERKFSTVVAMKKRIKAFYKLYI